MQQTPCKMQHTISTVSCVAVCCLMRVVIVLCCASRAIPPAHFRARAAARCKGGCTLQYYNRTVARCINTVEHVACDSARLCRESEAVTLVRTLAAIVPPSAAAVPVSATESPPLCGALLSDRNAPAAFSSAVASAGNARHGTAQHGKARHGAVRRSTARQNTARP